MPYGWPDAPAPKGNRISRWFGGQVAELKALAGGEAHFSTLGGGTGNGASWWWDSSHRGPIDYAASVGDGSGTSIVEPVVRWIGRNLPQAPVRTRRLVDAEEWKPVPFHPMIELLEEPNPHYDGKMLLKATAADLTVDGNGYWWKIRSGAGRPAELWWIPSALIEPRWNATDDTVFITHYDYRPGGGRTYQIPPEDIIHFRDGIDPTNVRKGMSGLKSVLREVFTDEEAARFTSTLLVNMGVPGTVISPAPGETRGPTTDEAEQVKQKFKNSTQGGNRGETMVFGFPAHVEQFGFSPQALDLKTLRRIPEERISAVTGVPAIVAGLGAGLDRSTFANYAEAREAGYEECIIPMQGLIASVLRRALLSEYVDELAGWDVYFDTSDVRILQEDQDKLSTRVGQQWKDGLASRAEARRKLGYDATEADEVYALPFNVVLSPVAQTLDEATEDQREPAPAPTPAQIGT